jgi:tripartite-type tricarboxylate transporter receptor subunit TctC
MVRRALLSCSLIAAAFALATSAGAQTLRNGTLSLVVPFAAGAPRDVAGRILAQGLQDALGQTVVVENPVGGGGTVGSLRVSRGPADGSAFVLGNNGTHSWSQSLYKHPPYETLKDFTPLGLAIESPRAIIVPKDLPANTLPEFIAYVKANQARIQFASAGAGSASHVSCVLLNAMLGVNVTHVPYRGLGPAMQDLIAGRVQYICDSVSTSKPQIEGGHVKSIATTGLKRSPALPNIPTAKEQGLDFDILTWQGLFLAKDTPAPVLKPLSAGFIKALDLPSVQQRFSAIGEEIPTPERRTPEYFKQFVSGEIARWSGPIKASGVTVE